MTGGALWRRYLRYTEDMTGTGDYINDPTEPWDCAPPRDDDEDYTMSDQARQALLESSYGRT